MGYLKAIERMDKSGGQSGTHKKPWLNAWHELASLTYGIGPGDPRLGPILEALNQCDEAFYADHWSAFRQGAQKIKAILRA